MLVRIGQVEFTMHRMAYEECIFIISMVRLKQVGFSSLDALICIIDDCLQIIIVNVNAMAIVAHLRFCIHICASVLPLL